MARDSFLLGVAHTCEKRVLQALLEGDAVVRVEDENFLKEVDSLRWGPRVLCLQVGPRICCKLFQVFQCFQVRHKAFVALSRCANDRKYDRQLIIRAEREPLPLLGRIFGR